MLDDSQSFPNDLLSGYKEFKENHLPEARARYEVLAELGQKPKTMIISCCDSRAAPETIFNSAPGELFVVRNVANLVPPYEADDGFHGTSAALEFAVQALKVENIVIMGHGRCGGKWITLLEPAKEKMVCEDGADFAARKRAMEEAGIRNSIDNLLTFPCVKTQVERGKITLHGAWFDISSGELYTMDHETGEFSVA